MKTTIDNLYIGGLSSCFATVFTNPLEVNGQSVEIKVQVLNLDFLTGGENPSAASR